jgi:hypothetical protein
MAARREITLMTVTYFSKLQYQTFKRPTSTCSDVTVALMLTKEGKV